MVLSIGALAVSVPVAIAVGPASVAAASGAGLAVAAGGGTATVAGGAAAAGVAAACTEAIIGTGAALVAAGPVGWICLGADDESWDCWRPVLRDFDSPATRGRLLKDVAADPRIVEIRCKTQEGFWPQFWLKNKWQEEFRIDYVQLKTGEIAAHAVRV